MQKEKEIALKKIVRHEAGYCEMRKFGICECMIDLSTGDGPAAHCIRFNKEIPYYDGFRQIQECFEEDGE